MSGLFDNLKVFAVKVVGYGDNTTTSDQQVQTQDNGWVTDIHKIAKTQSSDIRDCRGSWNLS